MGIGEDVKAREAERRLGGVDARAGDAAGFVVQAVYRELFWREVGLQHLAEDGLVGDSLAAVVFAAHDAEDLGAEFLALVLVLVKNEGGGGVEL